MSWCSCVPCKGKIKRRSCHAAATGLDNTGYFLALKLRFTGDVVAANGVPNNAAGLVWRVLELRFSATFRRVL